MQHFFKSFLCSINGFMGCCDARYCSILCTLFLVCCQRTSSSIVPESATRLATPLTHLKAGRCIFKNASSPEGFVKKMTPPIHTLTRLWLADRFCPIGGTDVAHFTLEKASIIECHSPQKTWLLRHVTYTGHFRISVKFTSADGQEKCTASAEATATRTMGDTLSFFERKKLWTNMTEDALTVIEDELRKQLLAQQHCAVPISDNSTAGNQPIASGPIWSQEAVKCSRQAPAAPITKKR
jgi:hypothetical protein